MNLTVHTFLNRLVRFPGVRASVYEVRQKRALAVGVAIQFCEDPDVVELPTGATVALGVKKVGDFGDEFLIYSNDFAWNAATESYEATMSWHTEELAVEFDANPSLESLGAYGEIIVTYSGGSPIPTETFPVVIERQIINGDEASPTKATPAATLTVEGGFIKAGIEGETYDIPAMPASP